MRPDEITTRARVVRTSCFIDALRGYTITWVVASQLSGANRFRSRRPQGTPWTTLRARRSVKNPLFRGAGPRGRIEHSVGDPQIGFRLNQCVAGNRGPAMLTGMTEDDGAFCWRFSKRRNRGGEPGHDDRNFLEALHFFTAHNITWRALPPEFGIEQHLEAILAAQPLGGARILLSTPGRNQPDRAHQTGVRQHGGARPCLGRRGKRGQENQALGRSRGGFACKRHFGTDFDDLPIAFLGSGSMKIACCGSTGRERGFGRRCPA